MYVYKYTDIYFKKHMSVYVYIHIYVYVCLYVHIYIYMCLYEYAVANSYVIIISVCGWVPANP